MNVGGGLASSVSLVELTNICQEVVGKKIKISSIPETRTADIPIYITDNSKVEELTGWSPKLGPDDIVRDIYSWIHSEQDALHDLLA